MKILVTGAAGFIGFSLTRALLATGRHEIVGIDNLNDYYSPRLKCDRLALLTEHEGFRFERIDIAEAPALDALFRAEQPEVVVHLAGQAGVRYSIDNPAAYVSANLVGFANVLECCRHRGVAHLVYASSSSVYGDGGDTPYREDMMTDSPVSLYAATKKADELMAHAYSHLFALQTTGLRFFTVYGPWGRPDMAPYLFLDRIVHGQPIQVFGHGQLSRDFTYIDDIVEGVRLVVEGGRPAGRALSEVYNIGHSTPVALMDFIRCIERVSGHRAECRMVPMQPGDVRTTCADTSRLVRDYGYRPRTGIDEGIARFYAWYAERELRDNK